MTSNDILRSSMSYLFDRMDEGGCFKTGFSSPPTAYETALLVQREAKKKGQKSIT